MFSQSENCIGYRQPDRIQRIEPDLSDGFGGVNQINSHIAMVGTFIETGFIINCSTIFRQTGPKSVINIHPVVGNQRPR